MPACRLAAPCIRNSSGVGVDIFLYGGRCLLAASRLLASDKPCSLFKSISICSKVLNSHACSRLAASCILAFIVAPFSICFLPRRGSFMQCWLCNFVFAACFSACFAACLATRLERKLTQKFGTGSDRNLKRKLGSCIFLICPCLE